MWKQGLGFEHMGYMNAVFHTIEDANAYYKQHNPHMRAITAHGGVSSDWDPHSYMRYVVRKYTGEILKFAPFDVHDAPTMSNGCIIFPDLPRAPRADYVRLPFVDWLHSLWCESNDPEDGDTHGKYAYIFPEVEDFLNDVHMTHVIDNHDTWDNFLYELSEFDHWDGAKKQAAADMYHEWYYGRGGRQLSPNYRRKKRKL